MRIVFFLLLLSLGALAGTTPESFTKAIRKGDQAKVQAMLNANPGLVSSREPRFKSTPLHTAAAKNRVTIVLLLLSKGADVNAGNDLKMTALHLCAQFNYPDLAKVLLENKADPNVRTKTGITPLRLAVANKNRGVADIIRAAGGTE